MTRPRDRPVPLRKGPRRTAVLALLGALLLSACRFETVPEEDIQASIETMLERTAEAWNAGDLDGVMSFYVDGASTALVTPQGPVFGREAIRAVYAPWFEAGARRARIRFGDVKVRTLPPLVGIVTGRRVREGGSPDPTSGWFTLVVRRVGNGWRIVHDHPDFLYTPISNQREVRPAADESRAGAKQIEETT